MNRLNAIVLSLMLLLSLGLGALTLKKDFAALESNYKSGKIDDAVDLLGNLKPTIDEERAFVIYYSAILKSNATESMQLHKNNVDKFPNALYAQKSMLELTKLNVLARNTDAALGYLRRITSPELEERYYWLAICSSEKEQYNDAINYGETYLKLSENQQMLENCYFVIADAYSSQKKYLSAASTLTRLGTLPQHPIDEQRYYFNLAMAYDKASKTSDALANYRRAYELNKYTQIAYQIEDRLFEMRSVNSSVDISFLYPYSELVIEGTQDVPKPDPVTPAAVDNSSPLKISGRPTSGYYLQAGRFSVADNALIRTKEIRGYGFPSAYFEEKQNGKSTWVVMSGPYTSQLDADSARNRLLSGNIDCFTVKY